VAPAYKQAKEGKISSKLKILIDFYEIVEEELDPRDPGDGNLLKKMEPQKIYSANYNFVMNLFAPESKKEDNDNK